MIEIIHNCDDFIVCIKPAGLISEFSDKTENSLPATLIKEGKATELFTVHRLDKEVGGLIVYAKNKTTAASLTKQIGDGSFKKEYVATVEGKPQSDSAELCDLLFHDRNKNKTYVVNRKRNGVKEARLSYKLITYSPENDLSTLKIRLFTGRTHQIRVQFASRKMPVCGDKKYGSAQKVSPIRLHSSALSFISPSTNQEVKFSHLPEWY